MFHLSLPPVLSSFLSNFLLKSGKENHLKKKDFFFLFFFS
uniref:Uncharacterized protein n=1 Tax=Rhizophora mucronata TaxID=61149 RepID=A0A2P2N137_RHIMU